MDDGSNEQKLFISTCTFDIRLARATNYSCKFFSEVQSEATSLDIHYIVKVKIANTNTIISIKNAFVIHLTEHK